ncbi:hypothetical protein CPC735_040680 [Coccidioides posadasii C735 delta SOWgp]|uniref:Uncharacterized protein n=1 Tax=Coccidioides posadasii (strain C735) TaxID=222929 RepID=C5P3B6_COCP7|nr:hypothetical protein CPC735_040680 [Coccidioides posadasii C735 delta SOWgp]EER28804.1 hypothetical protein CPC735_040680 [Coccidioides posadasii C735 delta SOWgp]|eukprot:XP_003070949.1 hypothetical protein CPC735_040680 [Coccidioides posadasii C735 delta SOWgp]
MHASYWARAPSALSHVTRIQRRYASARTPRAPSVRNRLRRPVLSPDFGSVPSPPLELFTSAIDKGPFKQGPNKLGWMEAIDIARKCIAAAQKSTETSSLNLERDIHADLHKICLVSQILGRSPRHSVVTEWIMPKLAHAGNMLAIVSLGYKALSSSTINGQPWLLQKIEILAREGKAWEPMVLHGSILEAKGELPSAANWYQKAIEITKPLDNEINYLSFFIPQGRFPLPLEAFANVQLKLDEIDKAEEAANLGALQYDSPRGYSLLLSALFKNESGWDHIEEYLTKCAMSHDVEACYRLGEIYRLWHLGLEKVEHAGFHDKFLSKKMLRGLLSVSSRYHSPTEYYSMAKEWLELAAAQGHPLASLQMAVLLRDENKAGEALHYRELAGRHPKYAAVATELQEAWEISDADITSIMRKAVEL